MHIFRGDEALNAVSNLEDELGALDVPFEAFETALSAALAHGLAEGRPPPARLIDVAAGFGLSELRPRAMTAWDWLEELDPEGAIASVPDGERDKLIRRSSAWAHDRPILDTWFEGTALLDDSLKAAHGRPGSRSGTRSQRWPGNDPVRQRSARPGHGADRRGR